MTEQVTTDPCPHCAAGVPVTILRSGQGRWVGHFNGETLVVCRTEQRSKEPIHHQVGCPQFPNQWADSGGPCNCGAESAAREKTVVVSSMTPYPAPTYPERLRQLALLAENLMDEAAFIEAADEIERLRAENERLRARILRVEQMVAMVSDPKQWIQNEWTTRIAAEMRAALEAK